MSSSTTQAMPPSATASFNSSFITAPEAADWCSTQQLSCSQICGQYASENTCNATTLRYTCICINGVIPDCTGYINTIPWYMCIATYEQCTDNITVDTEADANCKANEQCGDLDPYDGNVVSLPGSLSTSSASTFSTSTSFANTSSSSTLSVQTSSTLAATFTALSSTKMASTPTSALPASSTSPTSHSLSNSIAAGISVGCTLFAFTAITIAAFFLLRWRRRSRNTTEVESVLESNFSPEDPKKTVSECLCQEPELGSE